MKLRLIHTISIREILVLVNDLEFMLTFYNRFLWLPLLCCQSFEFVLQSDCVSIKLVGSMLQFGNVIFYLVYLFQINLETLNWSVEKYV